MATNESLVLDSLQLNDGTTYTLEAVTMAPPRKRPEWQQGGDSDGAVLGRDPLFDSRVVTARVRVEPQSTTDLALAKIAAIIDRLEESERNQAGVDLVWTPADATKSVTFKVLSGEIDEMPIVVDGDGAGWFVRAPMVQLTFTCRPFGYGVEVVGTPVTSALPMMTVELTGVTGDVPAEGRLIVTDAATQARRHVEWGLESRYYPTSSPPGLIVDSDSMTALGGAQTTRTGSYDPNATGNNVIRGTLSAQPLAVCSTGAQTHVGIYRVKARVWAQSSYLGRVQVRLSWHDGDGPLRSNAYVTPVTINAFAEVDLGTITISPALLGAQQWTGQIDAYSTFATDTLDVDYVMLIPAGEGRGVVRAAYSYLAGSQVARDEFAAFTPSGTALNARVAPVGGTWATSGNATDLVSTATTDSVTRSVNDAAAPGRFAILGAASYTNVEVGVDFVTSDLFTTGVGTTPRSGVIARWTDANNHVSAALGATGGTNLYQMTVSKVVAGTVTPLAYAYITSLSSTLTYSIRLVAYASGAVYCDLLTGGTVILSAVGSDSALATGGTLATGKPGIVDQGHVGSSGTRTYDNFYAATPALEPIALYSGRVLEIRSDATKRQNSAGTIYGDAPSYRGARFYVPVAGVRNRKARIAVKARRNDVDGGADDQIADNLTVQANYVPRFLAIPR